MSDLAKPESVLLVRHRADQHDHLTAFHLGEVFDAAHLFGVFGDAFQQLAAQILVCHLTTAKAQGDFDFVAIVQKLEHVPHFDLIVICIGVRSELDLFDLDDLLLFARFGFALLRLVFEFAEIHDLAHGRVGVGRDLDQVQPGFFGHFHGTAWRDDPDVFAVGTDQTNFIRADIFVNARARVSLWRRVMWSASDDERPLIVP